MYLNLLKTGYMEMQIRKLPYGIIKKLSDQLDIDGPRDWRALISVMPIGMISQEQVIEQRLDFSSIDLRLISIKEDWRHAKVSKHYSPLLVRLIYAVHCVPD